MWLTVEQGFVCAMGAAAVWLFLRHLWPKFAPAALETAIVMGLYTLWRILSRIDVRVVIDDAMRRADEIWRFERAIGLGNERWLQQRILPYPLVVKFFNQYYAYVHVPSMIVFLIWFFFRHRDAYSPWRSVLALSTMSDMFIRLIAVAPPRLLPDLNFVDTGLLYDQSVYGKNLGAGISNQVAAMPSIHCGWAILIAAALWKHGNRWERIVGLLHAVLTLLAVVLTANHWWLDGIVAGLILIPWWYAWTRGHAFVTTRWRKPVTPLDQEAVVDA